MADVASYMVPFDLDTGGGTELVIGVSLRTSGAGGSTEAKGQQTMALSLPVALASDQASIPVSTELPTAILLADNAATPTVPAVGGFGMVYDGATWDFQRGDATDGTLVNLGGNNDVTISGSVDTELPAPIAAADALANPTAPQVLAHMMGFNGTTWDRVDTANTGRLQVDVITGGGSDTPTNPVINTQTSVAVAAGTTVNLDTPEAASKKLARVDVWASVAWKGEVFTVDNGAESTRLGICGGPPHASVQYVPTHRDYITLGATAGVDAFRLKFTNLDDNQAADAHAVFHYED